MKIESVGFLGGGRVARILLGGWNAAGVMPSRVVVDDPDQAALGRLKTAFPSIEVGVGAGEQDLVLLAVHPPVLPTALGELRSKLRADSIVLSLAPKFTLGKVGELLGGFDRLARMIPNAPSLIGAGYNPIAFGSKLSAPEQDAVRTLFAPLGECPEVDERKLEAYALLSGMGPTYLWFQLQALRDVTAGFGLGPEEIHQALKRTVCGATRTLLESGLTPAEVMDLIPVKPLAEMESSVGEMYRTRLPALYDKIKP